eukprot:TRINITY_DN3239_c0_g1_i4.p1 TRINITY_DN3239_c0_g1~~TRINITY_DN3239_c0_g1_i4.p1  ORF type:complete len:375 (-),score=31.10 TRINITY_DN3239_c0_g1_i4:222-1346(-)
MDWVVDRFLINVFTFLIYTGFWHVALYWLGWSKRKFNPFSVPALTRVLHNFFYSVVGMIIITGWECITVNLWATGRLPYMKNEEIFSSARNIFLFSFWSLLIPRVRDLHLYFVHRFIHYRALYKYIHSLHHRNIDIEPFSGLSMHPIEHLYYITCMGLSLYFYMSPFHLLFMGIHLFLAPGASHSGWEDHWHSDVYHYLHHINFECNYGASEIPFDKWFGTYRDRIDETKLYDSVPGNPRVQKNKKVHDSYVPSGSVSLHDCVPEIQSFVYMSWSTGFFLMICYCLSLRQKNGPFDVSTASGLALFFSLAPILFASFLWFVTRDSIAFNWPFHKDSLGVTLFHLIFSFVTIIPLYHLLDSSLAATTVYCRMWGC